jgi:hypothetical protein
MLKKIISVVMALLFSLGVTAAFAKNSVKSGPKKWDPFDKPTGKQALYDEQGNAVDVKNLAEIKGKILYDKKGNAFELQKGKIIRFEKNKKLHKRIGPGPVA